MPPPMTSLATHPEGNSIRLQLRQNLLLQGISAPQWAELEPLLAVADYRKGDPLVRQGDEEMEQFFIVDGMLKRVVSNPQGREMILRFAADSEMDTSYAAWRLRTPVPYSIVAVTKVRTAELPMPVWSEFIERHREVKERFEYEVMKLMSEVMAHTITLHLLDAPGRLARFQRTVELAPDSVGALGNAASAQRDLGHAEEALELLRAARRLAPDDLDVLSAYLFTLNFSTRVGREEIFREHLECERLIGTRVP